MKNFKKTILVIINLFLLTSFCNALARPVIADVFPRKIDIDHKFKGVDVLIYGARNDAGNIIIVVRGPKKDYVLRKKGKVAGIWTNIETKEIKNMYSFYSISSMRAIEDIQNESLLESLDIGLKNLKYKVIIDGASEAKTSGKIKSEINELMEVQQLYSDENYEILFWGETLFRTFIKFPKNIIRGTYNIDIYLFNDGLLNSFQTLPVIVEQVGFEAFMFDFAHQKPAIYGIIAVLIALIAGWFASVLFRGR